MPCPWCNANLDDESYEPWGAACYQRILTCEKCGKDCAPIITKDSITLEGLLSVTDIAYLQAMGKLPQIAAE